MSILSDLEITARALENNMISPFEASPVREVDGKKVISYGTSSYGYDMRLADEFQLFKASHPSTFGRLIDPLDFDSRCCEYLKTTKLTLPPHSFALGRSLESFNIPRDILGMCYGKSTYARCGVYLGITPMEPTWVGHLTIEIANITPLPVIVYANQGIAQVVFHKADPNHVCAVSYEDKKGKYQNQVGIVFPKG